MDDIGGMYRESRRRLSEIGAQLTDAEAAQRVLACPEWTVRDVYAHLAGVCTDVLDGRVEGLTTAAWADRHAQDRKDRTMGELLAEWAVAAPRLEASSDRSEAHAGILWILDQAAHEHDIRGALDRPGARDSPAVRTAVDWLVTYALHGTLQGHGLGPLQVRTADACWTVGALPSTGGGAAPTLDADLFELFRALTGRRSTAQIAAFAWSTDPAPFLPAFEFGTFTTRSGDLVE